jgi:hypothetical protein
MSLIRRLWRHIQAMSMNAATHYVAATMWLGLMWPTTTTWKTSVLWVGLISCYANFISHWGTGAAYSAKVVAGRAEQAAKDAVEIVRMGVQEDTEMLHRIEKTVTHDD